MRVLLDTNVLLDVALWREPYFYPSLCVMRWCQTQAERTMIAWHSISNFHYVARRGLNDAGAREFLGQLLDWAEVAPTAKGLAKNALAEPGDFEDLLQLECALAGGASVIATRNVRDFSRPGLAVVTPGQFLAEFAI